MQETALETRLGALLDEIEEPADILDMLRTIAMDRTHQTTRSMQERQAWSAWEHGLAKAHREVATLPNPYLADWDQIIGR